MNKVCRILFTCLFISFVIFFIGYIGYDIINDMAKERAKMDVCNNMDMEYLSINKNSYCVGDVAYPVVFKCSGFLKNKVCEVRYIQYGGVVE